MSIKDKAIIIRVRSTVWSARRYDKQLSLHLTQAASAAKDAARVNQYLLTGADYEFKEISVKLRIIREFVDHATVPWDAHGGRLITPKAYFDLLPSLNALTDDFYNAVKTFINVYPERAVVAQQRLGSMLKPEMYPSVQDLVDAFRVGIDTEAVPTLAPGDLRGGADEAEIERLRESVERTVARRINESITAQWHRLLEDVTRLNSSVAPRDDKANRIYTTTVEGLRHTAKVLRDINVTEDPDLDKLCGDVLDALALASADTLRISPSQRERVFQSTDKVKKTIEGLLL